MKHMWLFVYARGLNLLLNNAKTYAGTSIVKGTGNVCIEDVWAKSIERDLKALAPAPPDQCRWEHVYVNACEWKLARGCMRTANVIWQKISNSYGFLP